jgi:hypothetical protein
LPHIIRKPDNLPCRQRFVYVVYWKMPAQRDKRVEVSALLRAGHKVSKVVNLVRVSRTTVYGTLDYIFWPHIEVPRAEVNFRICSVFFGPPGNVMPLTPSRL